MRFNEDVEERRKVRCSTDVQRQSEFNRNYPKWIGVFNNLDADLTACIV